MLLASDLRGPAEKGDGLRFADLIGPWKAAGRAGWGHGHHFKKYHAQGCALAPIVSITIKQGRTVTLPLDAGTAATSGPHVLCYFLGVRLVLRHVNKEFL